MRSHGSGSEQCTAEIDARRPLDVETALPVIAVHGRVSLDTGVVHVNVNLPERGEGRNDLAPICDVAPSSFDLCTGFGGKFPRDFVDIVAAPQYRNAGARTCECDGYSGTYASSASRHNDCFPGEIKRHLVQGLQAPS